MARALNYSTSDEESLYRSTLARDQNEIQKEITEEDAQALFQKYFKTNISKNLDTFINDNNRMSAMERINQRRMTLTSVHEAKQRLKKVPY